MRRLIGLLAGAAILGVIAWAVSFASNPESAKAFSSGFTGRSQTGCGSCHGGSTANPGAVITVSGPTSVTPGSTNSYTVSLSGSPTNGGGVDVSVSRGTLVAGVNTNLVGGELVHMNGSSRSWTFSWTAPAAPGPITMYVAGNAVNLDGGTGGDAWNVARLSVTVATAPTSTPTNTPVAPTSTPVSGGRQLYNTYCASCHERSSPGFVGETVYGESANDIIEAINEVPRMRFLRGVLTNQQINDIATYLRTVARDHENRDRNEPPNPRDGRERHEDGDGGRNRGERDD